MNYEINELQENVYAINREIRNVCWRANYSQDKWETLLARHDKAVRRLQAVKNRDYDHP